MKARKRVIVGVILLLTATLPISRFFTSRFFNPYEKQGLRTLWSYGYGGTVPTVRLWAEDQEGQIAAPIEFHGLTKPKLRYYDWDNNGHIDIVFSSGEKYQVMSYFPREGQTPPKFEMLRNDIQSD